MFRNRRSVATALLACVGLAFGCGGDSTAPAPSSGNPPTTETPTATAVTGLTVAALSLSSIRVTFTSKTGDNSYTVERAEGTTGSFGAVSTITAPATAGTVTFTDANLKTNTLYRYRVFTVLGNSTSAPSSEASATTLTALLGAADITGDITANRTLFAETTYTIKGFIHVTNGATLTIRPGTTIKGDYNTLGSSLFIMRGAKIQALGTADAPIVFTSSRAAGQRQPGDWGGLVIVGNGVQNRSGSVPLDGTGTDGTGVVSGKNYQVLYSGGTTQSDNSGTMNYVRVEFAGYAPSLDNGLDAFTFAAVGSGTRVSYLQSLASLDDAYAFFGGALDGDHLVAYETGDDMFDMTDGFSGRLQFLIGYNSTQLTPRAGAGTLSTDVEGIESDGCNGTGCDNGFNQQPFTTPLVANFTLVGCASQSCSGSSGGIGIMLRRGSGGLYVNGVVLRFPMAGVSMRDIETFTRANLTAKPDLSSADLQLRNIFFTESGLAVFQAATSPAQTQFALDLAANNLTAGSTVSQSLFTALPTPLALPTGVASFDWTPPATSPIITGGMTQFTGRIFQKAESFVTPTAYLGAAAPGGAKWWAGWTSYARN